MLVTGYHGQFEEIPLLFVAAALLLALPPACNHAPAGRERSRALPIIASALALGVAIAYKSWPLLFLPPLLLLARARAPRRLWPFYAPLALVPLGLSVAAHALAFGPAGWREAATAVLGYDGSKGFCWGYASVVHPCWVSPRLRPGAWVAALNGRLLVVGLLLAAASLPRRRPLDGLIALPLVFLLLGPGWGPNYSVWLLPWACAAFPILARRYTLVMLPAVALTYLDSLYAAHVESPLSWAVSSPRRRRSGWRPGQGSWPSWSCSMPARGVCGARPTPSLARRAGPYRRRCARGPCGGRPALPLPSPRCSRW